VAHWPCEEAKASAAYSGCEAKENTHPSYSGNAMSREYHKVLLIGFAAYSVCLLVALRLIVSG